MKKILILLLLGLSMICLGQNRDSIYRHSIIGTKAEIIQKKVDSIKKSKDSVIHITGQLYSNSFTQDYRTFSGSVYSWKKVRYLTLKNKFSTSDTVDFVFKGKTYSVTTVDLLIFAIKKGKQNINIKEYE